MTPNDTQMDVLLRRYAKGATPASVSTEHLDADELSAFAEGALPAATRSRYVSHLADCDDCRTVVSQLAVSAGAAAAAHVPASEAAAPASWWQKAGALFSVPALRYAASALVLIAVVGVAFVVWRPQQRESTMVAKNEPTPSQVNAVSSPPVNTKSDSFSTSAAPENPLSSPAAPTSSLGKKGLEPPAELDAPATKPAKDAAEAEVPGSGASDRVMKAPVTESSPSYAPPPAGEGYNVDNRQQQVQTQQQNVAGNLRGGPRRSESNEKSKAGAVNLAKSRDEDQTRGRSNQPAENKQEEARPDTSGTTASKSAPPKEEARKLADKVDGADRESSETASVGGRKFRRQGNVWVDTKFRSSMSVTYVSRDSDEFADLDSGLRSIAHQLSGEVLVVWKEKAYRIR